MNIQKSLFTPALIVGASMLSTAALAATSAPANLNVTLKVNPSCSISATTLAFPAQDGLNALVDASASLTLTCTNGTNYNVQFDNGANAQGTQRRMKNAGNAFVNYQIYKEDARTTVLGSIDGTDTIGGTGTGTAQNPMIYGRVPAQPLAVVGDYTDTVQMTVSY